MPTARGTRRRSPSPSISTLIEQTSGVAGVGMTEVSVIGAPPRLAAAGTGSARPTVSARKSSSRLNVGDEQVVPRVAVDLEAHERQGVAGHDGATVREVGRAAVLEGGALLLLDRALELDPHHRADRLAVGVEQLVGDADLDRPALEDEVPPDELEVVRLVRVALVLGEQLAERVDVVEDAVRLGLAVDEAGVVEEEVEGELLGERVLELDLRAAACPGPGRRPS